MGEANGFIFCSHAFTQFTWDWDQRNKWSRRTGALLTSKKGLFPCWGWTFRAPRNTAVLLLSKVHGIKWLNQVCPPSTQQHPQCKTRAIRLIFLQIYFREMHLGVLFLFTFHLLLSLASLRPFCFFSMRYKSYLRSSGLKCINGLCNTVICLSQQNIGTVWWRQRGGHWGFWKTLK